METLKLPKNAPDVPQDLLDGIEEPVEVLDELHRPMFYTCRNRLGMLLLGYVAAEDENGETLFFAPTSEVTVAKVKSGQVTMLEALTPSWIIAVQWNQDGQIVRACLVENPMTLESRLPAPGATLYFEHMPVLAARALGGKIGPGLIPSSVVVTVTESVRKAMKLLMDFVRGSEQPGRPSNESRMLFDLAVQRFAFRSFEVSFGTAQPIQEVPQIEASMKLLQKGLEWTRNRKILNGLTEEEKDVVLRAVYMLAPPTVGYIDSVEISGSFLGIGNRPFKLNQKLRKEIALIQAGKGPREVLLQGHLFEANSETLTCQMRVTKIDDAKIDEPGQVYTLIFDDDFYQVAHAAVDEAPARVFGTFHPKKQTFVDVQSIQLRPLSDSSAELDSEEDGGVTA